jgi:hypothetical protein
MADGYRYARPTLASQQVGYIDDGYDNPYNGTVRQPLPYAVNDVRAVPRRIRPTSRSRRLAG